jgi:hypothetical protein
MNCADCGAVVESYPPRNRWASKIAANDFGDAWSFHCRRTFDLSDGEILVAADYHHVEGEPQEHFPPAKSGYTNPMARRHLTLTLTITLDEDLCRQHDQPSGPDGDSPYHDTIHTLRTTLQHHTAVILAPYNPELGNPTVNQTGITYTI